MNVFIRRALSASAVAGGIAAASLALAGTASADSTSGEQGLLSGNQSGIRVTAPVEIGGNQVVVLGSGNKASGGGTAPAPAPKPAPAPAPASTSGSGGAASGNQAAVEVRVPVTASGNQVNVAGRDNTVAEPAPQERPRAEVTPERLTTDGTDGLVAGNQSLIGIEVPVTVCGNQVTVLASGNSAGCGSASTATDRDTGSTGGDTTGGQDGTGSGDQTDLGLLAPITADGNQLVVIGDDNASAATATTPGGDTTTGENGAGSGSQTDLGLLAPITAVGNQLVVIGDGNTSTGGGNTGNGSGGATGDDTTTGENGTGSGSQTDLGLLAPITAVGNQLVVIGDDNANTSTGTGTTPGGSTGSTGDDTTSGENGTGSGNQTDLDVLAPITADDNQVIVIGDGNTDEPEVGTDQPGTDGPGTDQPGTDGPGTDNPGTDGPGTGSDSPGTDLDRSVQAGSASADGTLPNTGQASSTTILLGLSMLLLLAGLALVMSGAEPRRGGAADRIVRAILRV